MRCGRGRTSWKRTKSRDCDPSGLESFENEWVAKNRVLVVFFSPMLTQYILKQLGSARYKLLEDGTYFGEIPRLQGVWASGSSLESCREELREVLESWLLLKLRSKDPIPGLKVQLRRLSHQYA